MESTLNALFDAIDTLVNDSEPWKEKRDYILTAARNSQAETNLLEFVSWFEGVDD